MKYPILRKGSLINRCRFYRLTVASPRHYSPGSLVLSLYLSIILSLFFTACPENNHPPPMADCDPGYHPCGEDSTECCLDTTSHNFVWEIDTLGDYGSYLNDVAIIDENNIWVVGNIETDSGEFNAARWDGSEWHLVKLLYTGTPPGSHSGTVQPGQAIYALSTGEIFIVAGTTFYWDGNDWEELYVPWGIFNGAVTELWGTSSSDIYFVGDNGSIVHYDGSGFERMESGTEVDIHSISGTGTNNVWVSGWNYYDLHRILLHYNGYEWDKIIDDYTDNEEPNRIKGRIAGVYTDNPDFIWVLTHKGLYKCSSNTTGEGQWLGEQSDPTSWVYAFVGSNHNDLFYGGSFTRLWHYNGSSFHFYHDIPDMGRIYGVGVTKLIVVVVGELINTSQAFVIRGYR